MDMINLREAPIVDKAEEGATLFALNADGTINRINAANVGGSGGIKVAFIEKASDSDDCTCADMTFQEAYDLALSGQLLIAYGTESSPGSNTLINAYDATSSEIYFKIGSIEWVYWYSDNTLKYIVLVP